jgi:general secretion pathway protein G
MVPFVSSLPARGYRGTRRRRGFTRLDVVVTSALLALLGSWLFPRAAREHALWQRSTAQEQICEFARAVDQYADENGAPPTTEQGLDALIHRPTVRPLPPYWRPYLSGVEQIPKDPWGNDYVYQAPGPNGDSFFLASYGPGDFKMGGTSDDADITSIGCGR